MVLLSCFPTVLPDEREFQYAAKMNNLDTMEKLFKENVNINAVDTVSMKCLTDHLYDLKGDSVGLHGGMPAIAAARW